MIPLRALVPQCLRASAALTLLLCACSSYTLEGRVVQGDFSVMSFVADDDPRLAAPAVAGARVTVVRDPDTLAREQVGTGTSDGFGGFAVPLSAFGAGYLEEVFQIRVSRPGYQTAEGLERLRAKDTRILLVVLGPGVSDPEPESLLEQYERFR